MKLITRGSIAAVLVATAALIAAGCGGGGGGASEAAKNAKALDFVPKSAIGYATVNTDFKGDDWKNFSEMATAFKSDFKDVGTQIEESTKDSDNKVDFGKDIEPWLGDNAGIALLDVNYQGATKPNGFAWIEIKDQGAFEKFAKDQGATKDGKAGDFDLWKDDKTYIAVSDELAMIGLSDTKADLVKIVKFDGDSIADADGVSDVAGEVKGDTLAAFVLSGDGVRKLINGEPRLKSLAGSKQIKDFKGLSVGFGVEDEGLRVHGFASGVAEVKNSKNELFQDLPETTLVAFGGNDLGGGIKSIADSLGKDNAQVQQTVGALSGALGVDLNDIAEAFGGEFALAVGGDDQVIGQLAGSAVGAAMGGGLSGIDPGAIAKSGNVTLAFEAKDSTAETMDKLVGAVIGLTGAGDAPKTGTAGDFETKMLDIGGLPLTAASSKDVAALSVGADAFTTWGSSSLGDSAAFKDAWKAADAPNKVAFSMFVDFGRIGKLAGIKGGDKRTAAGWVGWSEGDGTKATFDLFMHIPKS